MLKKCFGLADERQQFRQEFLRIFTLQYINVTRTDPGEIGHRNLALIRPAFAEQNLSRLEHTGEGNAISNITPAPNPQVFRFDMIKTDIPIIAIGDRITAAVFGQAHNIAEFDSLPAGF